MIAGILFYDKGAKAMQKQTKGSILLLLCAMIWGAAFVAQSEGMQYVGPFTMLYIRSLKRNLQNKRHFNKLEY